MRLIQLISNSSIAKPPTLISIVSVLAVIGPVIVVSAGFWDAISHLQKEPEFFWSTPHIVVYTGVSMTSFGAILGVILLVGKLIPKYFKTGVTLVIVGSMIQLISGFGDSISHEIYGIDGLISWSHQPLEIGLVLASLGGFMILKNNENSKLKKLIPFSIITFLFFTTWLLFNLALIFGHTIQCIPVYELFSSGCAIL